MKRRPLLRRSIRIPSLALTVAIHLIVVPWAAEKRRGLSATRTQPGAEAPSPLAPSAASHADGTARPPMSGGVTSPPGGIQVKLEMRMLRRPRGGVLPYRQ